MIWDKKELWRRRGGDFLVEVSRHYVEPTPHIPSEYDRPGHRWAVYAYIYPGYPLFDSIHAVSLTYGASILRINSLDMPMHSGPSLVRLHWDENQQVTSIQIGADYNHEYDDFYRQSEYCQNVFNDAEKLFEWLIEHGGTRR